MSWRDGGSECSGSFGVSPESCHLAEVGTQEISFRQTKDRLPLTGIDEVVRTEAFDPHTFGLQWSESPISPKGEFPRHFRDVGDARAAVPASEVPEELRAKRFKPAVNKKPYSSPGAGAWADPGPRAGPFSADLADGSRVTYHWYRFLDQPSLQQHRDAWSDTVKSQMQSVVEKIHGSWPIDGYYMPPPTNGMPLVEIDPALIVTPPAGLGSGYVPIVTRQEEAR